jgi:ribosomal protein L37E
MDQPTIVVRPCSRCGRPCLRTRLKDCASCLFEVGLETLTRESQDEAQTIDREVPALQHSTSNCRQDKPGAAIASAACSGVRMGRGMRPSR